MIKYNLIRSQRKTLVLQVRAGRELIVRSPLSIPLSQIERFIREKRLWIEKHLNTVKHTVRKHYSQSERESMKESLRKYIIPRVHDLAYGKNLPAIRSIKITSPEFRWGSCSSRQTLCFSYRLAEYLPETVRDGVMPSAREVFIDAVILHELAHLKEKNHKKPFWKILISWMPEYRKVVKYYQENDMPIG